MRYLWLLLLVGCSGDPLEGFSMLECRWKEGATVSAPPESCALLCTESGDGYSTRSLDAERCETWTCQGLDPNETAVVVYDVARHQGVGPDDYTFETMTCEELAVIRQTMGSTQKR